MTLRDERKMEIAYKIHRGIGTAGALHGSGSRVSGQFRIRIYNFLGRVKSKNLIFAQIGCRHGQCAQAVLYPGGRTYGKICGKILLISGGVGEEYAVGRTL